MKKFGKFLFGTAVLGTITAAAAYYYYQKKEEESVVLDKEGDGEETEAPKRSYTSLDDISEVAKNLGETVKTTAGKVGKTAKEAYTKVKDKLNASDDLEDLFEEFEEDEEEDDFTPLSETAQDVTKPDKETADKSGKTVEEFFDDSDNAEGSSEEVKK